LKRHSLGTFQLQPVSPSKRAEQFNSTDELLEGSFSLELLDPIVPSELQDDDERALLDSSWLSPLRMTLDDDFAFWLLEDELINLLEDETNSKLEDELDF
jgi:hypothetical protein